MFKIYNVRPGGVDWTAHPEIHAFIPKQALYKRMMIPAFNLGYKGIMTPTRQMGRVFTELAMSRGERLEGSGVEMEGTLLSNVGIRRLSGL
jgi:hypothetical protein